MDSPCLAALAGITARAFLTHILFGLGLTALSAAITWLMASRVRILDIPNQRSSHSQPTPRSGGVAIVLTFLVGLAAIFLWGDRTPIGRPYFQGFLAASMIVALISFADDVRPRPLLVRLAVQTAASLAVLAAGIVIDEIGFPWQGTIALGWLAWPVSLLWILGLTNAFNFMDGLDGLAAGVAVLVSLLFALITLSQGSTFVYITCYAVAAGALGFLAFNFSPARIFMGDVGSAFLGFVFATLAIIAARYDHSHTSFFVMPLLVMGFLFDTAFTLIRRWRAGEKVTEGHRSHLYQLLARSGWSHRQVSLLHYGMVVLQGGGAILMLHITGDQRVLIFIPFLLLHSLYAWLVIRRARAHGLLAGGQPD
ncbi:MAG: glycosyltransferase family 4 protein [Thermodesulfobacteriota bacterium]